VNGEPLDPARGYRIGTFSFLAQGGDNFAAFKEGTDVRDSGLVDRDAWISYLKANSPLSPSFDRRGVLVQNAPTTVQAGGQASVTVSKLDLTSLGSPVNTSLNAAYVGADGVRVDLGNTPVTTGSAAVTVTIPTTAAGPGRIVLTAAESKTTVTLFVTAEPVVVEKPVCGNGNGPKADKPVKGEDKPGSKKCTPPGRG
jgi:5'-nucleotidase